MRPEWDHLTLGEVAAVKSGFAFKSKDWRDVGVPVVKIANVRDGRLEMQGCSFVAPELAATAGEFQLSVDDILIAMTGYIGEVAVVRCPDLPAVLNQRVGRFTVIDRNRLDKRFLFQLLRERRPEIEALGHGSAQPNVSPALLHGIRFHLPPLGEQCAIAQILGTLDDKIELNLQTNETLEGIARAVFKSWFVDFDPVRAKADGQEPVGMSREVADLFPDGFEDSAQGEIPVGWDATNLGEMVEIHDALRIPLSKKERAGRKGEYPYYGAADMMDYVDDYLFDGIYLLMGEDGSVAREDGTPFLQYVWGKFWVNNHAHVLRGKNGISTEHLMLLLKQTNIYPYVTGAVQAKLNQGNLKRIDFLKPSDDVCRAFDRYVSGLYARYRSGVEESTTLAQIRDTLLPKLLSGEIRIKDAEKIVGEAT